MTKLTNTQTTIKGYVITGAEINGRNLWATVSGGRLVPTRLLVATLSKYGNWFPVVESHASPFYGLPTNEILKALTE